MSNYYLEVDEGNSLAKSFITFLLNYAKNNKHVTISKTPNKETIAAIEEAKRGEGEVVSTKEELSNFFDHL